MLLQSRLGRLLRGGGGGSGARGRRIGRGQAGRRLQPRRRELLRRERGVGVAQVAACNGQG